MKHNNLIAASEQSHYDVKEISSTYVAVGIWEQLHIYATLLKFPNWPHNIATVFSELYRGIKKPSGKADLVIYIYFVTVSG